MAGYVFEFKCWMRVGVDAEDEAKARERAEEICDEITEGPKDAQLSIEDNEPTVEEV